MAFYKRDGGEILEAPNFVSGPGFELLAENHNEYVYPVEGWYWFDNADEANQYLSIPNLIDTFPR